MKKIGRPRVENPAQPTSYRIPTALRAALDVEAKSQKVTRSKIVQIALAQYLGEKSIAA